MKISSNKIGLIIFFIIFIWLFFRTYNNEICKNGEYDLAKGIFFKKSVDGNGNSGIDFYFNVSGEKFDGFSLTNSKYNIKIGDTLMIEYCSDTKNISEIIWSSDYMDRYKISK